MITLPKVSLLDPMADPPHRHKVLAERVITNEHGARVRIRCITNWPETRWWLTAGYVERDGGVHYRASNGMTTGSSTKAEAWKAALAHGEVKIANG